MVLSQDETLKRLLWYPPQDLSKNIIDAPLSSDLPNISNNEELNWQVIEDRILLNSKSDDLVDDPKCRIYLYLGDVNSTSHSVFIKQEIVIDILWHEVFNADLRFDSITQTLKSLLVGKHITGIGKMEYYDGMPIGTPKNYSGYRHIFQVGSTKS